tara:strand:+ start:1642 stop:1848 length:207 start_codon:yes stop_codon:yes gene_type:complete
MFKIIAAGLITFALTGTTLQQDTPTSNPWSYKSPTETEQLRQVTHCYKWLPVKIKQIQKVKKPSKNKK